MALESNERHNEVGGIAADRLQSLIERRRLGSDIKDIYAETKSIGFDVKVMRQIIALRKKEPAEIEEAETVLDLYPRV